MLTGRGCGANIFKTGGLLMARKWFIVLPLALILALVGAVIVWLMWVTVDWVRQSGVHLYAFQTSGVSAEAEEKQTFSAQGITLLEVNNLSGEISVTGVPGSKEIIVTAHKKAWGSSQKKAKENLAEVKLVTSQEDDTLYVSVEEQEQVIVLFGERRPPLIDLAISAPPEVIASLTNRLGDLSVIGMRADIDLNTEFGAIEVKDVTGSLLANADNGRIMAYNIHAGDEAVTLQTQFGDIHLSQADMNSLKVDTQSGKIALNDVTVKGEASLHSEFGDLTYRGGSSGQLTLDGNNGPVDLQDLEIKGPLTVETEFGAIQLKKVNAEAYDLKSNSGKIEANGVSGMLTARSEFGDIFISKGKLANLDLVAHNGSIIYQGSLGSRGQSLESEFGFIQLSLPAESAFDFDLQTQFGAITSDFDMAIQKDENGESGQGKVNGGGALLSAVTNNGNITIEIKQSMEESQ
jgi:DUF4097 and DUF4098 domain-containing protein YvlB